MQARGWARVVVCWLSPIRCHLQLRAQHQPILTCAWRARSVAGFRHLSTDGTERVGTDIWQIHAALNANEHRGVKLKLGALPA